MVYLLKPKKKTLTVLKYVNMKKKCNSGKLEAIKRPTVGDMIHPCIRI